MTELPPFVLFYVAAILAAVLPHRLRQVLMLLVPAVGGLAISNLPAGSLIQVDIMSLSLEPLRVDRLSILFGYLFHIAAFLGVLFSLHLRDRLQHVAGLLYAGSALVYLKYNLFQKLIQIINLIEIQL